MTHIARCRAFSAAIALALACSKSQPDDGRSNVAVSQHESQGGARSVVVFDPINQLDACMLGYRGVLLDVGDASAAYRSELGVAENIERAGATWARLRSNVVRFSFVATAQGGDASSDATPVYVELRARGLAARKASVWLNGKGVGGFVLPRDEPRVVVARGGPGALVDGANTLTVRFEGMGARADYEWVAEIDWIHVGTGSVEPSYAAPTRQDVLVNAVLGGVTRRALALRAPGFVRCVGWIPASSQLELQAGSVGSGDVDAELRLLRDLQPPLVIGTVHLPAAAQPRWTPVSVPMPDLGALGVAGAIELVSVRASKGARVLFGEPRLVARAPPSAPMPPPARNAVLVVLSSVSPRVLSPYGGARATPELAALARDGAIFEGHTAASPFANAAVASMLTGLAPDRHGLVDKDARLGSSVVTVAEAARDAGIVAAFLSANPTTGAAFGFARGWETFEAAVPRPNVSATKVFDDAARWLDVHKGQRFLLVVHARGAHPPWDVSGEQLQSLPPLEYAGPVDPRRSAELLSKPGSLPASLDDEDRIRLAALYGLAVDTHDSALGRLLAAMRTAGRADDTAVLVTSDIGIDLSAPLPFEERGGLSRAALRVPLVAYRPGMALTQKRVQCATSGVDVAATLLETLGLEPPSAFEGESLWRVARGASAPIPRPLFTMGGGRQAVLWGPFARISAGGKEIKVCDLVADPACASDTRAARPLAAEALRRFALLRQATSLPPPPPREPASIDLATTAAALRAWGW